MNGANYLLHRIHCFSTIGPISGANIACSQPSKSQSDCAEVLLQAPEPANEQNQFLFKFRNTHIKFYDGHLILILHTRMIYVYLYCLHTHTIGRLPACGFDRANEADERPICTWDGRIVQCIMRANPNIRNIHLPLVGTPMLAVENVFAF